MSDVPRVELVDGRAWTGTVEAGERWSTAGSLLNIYGNLDEDDSRQIIAHYTAGTDGLETVQFARRFDVDGATLDQIDGPILEAFPQVTLQTNLNGHGAFDTLDFLRHVPNLRAINIELSKSSTPLEPLLHHGKFTSLSIGSARMVSAVDVASQLPLRTLGLRGKIRDLDRLGECTSVEELSLTSLSSKDLSGVASMPSLTRLAMAFGGIVDFEALRSSLSLSYTRLFRLQGVQHQHLVPLNDVDPLRTLILEELPYLHDLSWKSKADLEVEVVNCRNFQG